MRLQAALEAAIMSLGFPGEGDAATALSSDARTLCHDCLNDLFCGLPCGIHKAASRAVTEIFCHVHFSFLQKRLKGVSVSEDGRGFFALSAAFFFNPHLVSAQPITGCSGILRFPREE